jgi:hypothetical protein
VVVAAAASHRVQRAQRVGSRPGQRKLERGGVGTGRHPVGAGTGLVDVRTRRTQ